MPPHKAHKPAEKQPTVEFVPDPVFDAPQPPAPTAPVQPKRYKVLWSGVSAAHGARYRGEVVSADDLGDAGRVAKLLDKKAIEEVADGRAD